MNRHLLLWLPALAILVSACGRPEPSQRPTGSDSTPKDSAAPAATTRAADTVAPATAVRDTMHPAPPKRPTAVDVPRTDTARAVPTPTSRAKDTVAEVAPVRDIYHPAPRDTVDGRIYQGWKYYNLNCARCHGEDVTGTTIAPHLILSLKPDGTIPDAAVFLQTVCSGRPDKGMPAWCALGLTPAQIDTIYAYVKGRSDATLHPGRPARRVE